MIYTSGIPLEETPSKATIDGTVKVDEVSKWVGDPGYVYVEGTYYPEDHYLSKTGSGWEAISKSEFPLEDSYEMSWGDELSLDTGTTDVSVELDQEDMGVDPDGVITLQPQSLGLYILELTKYDYKYKRIYINVN